MINKIDNITKTVKWLLQRFPETRDNDRLLIVKVWAEQNPQLRDGISFKQWAVDYISDNYADAESIRRSRQKIQEQHPELRGKSYAERQRLESKVRQGIVELNT